MEYDQSVFINCPFDDDYQPLFRALVFAVHACGFVPRCSLEVDDGSQVRIEKIRGMIAGSRFGIHDISRTELDAETALPRFNMPLELGLFLGAKHFGAGRQRQKACVIFDRERWRYQKFVSDIAGQDIRSHGGSEEHLIRGVRNALRSWVPDRSLPAGSTIIRLYFTFLGDLPGVAARLGLDPEDLTFNDLTQAVQEWLRMMARYAQEN